MLTHPERLVILWIYALLAGVVLAGELVPTERRHSPWSMFTPLLALPAALILALCAGLPTATTVMWLCNDCSEYRGGSGHFDEDVCFAHVVTLTSLAWLGLTGWWHRHRGWHDWALIPMLPPAVYCSVTCWEMVFSFHH